ncbi:protein spindle-F-like [Homalodisca vitripennis]|uniref:protein spindle-F-like n=1 Tax=Homalodisca vitripennis TaxID=197043 RepID=UPI001EEB3905|nr:protein spindle-F-like [Homalodisca vitripennis]
MSNKGQDGSVSGGGNFVKTDKEISNTMSSSLYALQVALQTMKERCQQLQQRLVVVEDENLRLRIENQRVGSHEVQEESKGALNALQEHIAQLSRQKSQLTHHIYMVATENKQLWTRLSKLTEANHSLGSHLTKISDTLNKHSLGESSKPNQSIHIVDSCEKEVDNDEKDGSLEEISLKIISSIIREKIELEQQCDQMSALQTGTLSVEDCDFTLGADLTEQEEVAQDLRKVMENMREQKEQLLKQQAGLRATLATLTALIKNGGLPCKKCRNNEKTGNGAANTSQNQAQVCEPPEDMGDNRVGAGADFEYFDEDRICPLCSQFFHRSAKFEDFHSHVLTHFSDEDGDLDSIISNNYHVVTRDNVNE